jgi:thiamine transporter
VQNTFIGTNNNYPRKGFGELRNDSAERTVEHCRPVEPEPDNTGGGKKMEESRKSSSHTRVLAEIVVFSALSAALYTIRPYTLPFGGSITLGSMIPVMWLALRRGVKVGSTAGVLFGILALPIDVVLVGASNIIASPVQVVLEYPLAFGALGLTGMFHKKTVRYAEAGVAISVFIKFLVHYFVGVYIWVTVYSFPPEYGQYLWPAVYNGSFLLVEYIISAILIAILVRQRTLEYAL